MGQYFKFVNLTKKEVYNPTCGLKLWEIMANNDSKVLPFLLRESDEIGEGGDINSDYEYAGRWAGDVVVVVGDYSTTGHYDTTGFKDITNGVIDDVNDFMGFAVDVLRKQEE